MILHVSLYYAVKSHVSNILYTFTSCFKKYSVIQHHSPRKKKEEEKKKIICWPTKEWFFFPLSPSPPSLSPLEKHNLEGLWHFLRFLFFFCFLLFTITIILFLSASTEMFLLAWWAMPDLYLVAHQSLTQKNLQFTKLTTCHACGLIDLLLSVRDSMCNQW